MPDLLGYRAKMGVVVPSTNTTMEPELYAMAPPGVTFHIARMYLAQSAIGSAEQAQAMVLAFQETLKIAPARAGKTRAKTAFELNALSEAELEQAWLVEAERRARELDRGEFSPSPLRRCDAKRGRC